MIALITGITGQDGSYLAELLLDKGYDVHGIIRRNSWDDFGRIRPIVDKVHLHYGDLSDGIGLDRIIKEVQPNEIYNLAAQSDVSVSFKCPDYTADVNAIGALRILDSIRNSCPACKFYQASTSELFGNANESPQKLSTPFAPKSPYASAKLFAYWSTVNYREAYGIHASNGILFNHESPRRGPSFVTRKIVEGVASIKKGKLDVLRMGNVNSLRDWGFAPDFVKAMWLMLQQKDSGDYVIATGESHSVREFCELAFSGVGIPIEWSGDNTAVRTDTGSQVICPDSKYYRPIDVNHLCGDSTVAREKLGWEPTVNFIELVEIMIRSEMIK